jgi:hypothetical protein
MAECIFGWGKQHGTMRKTKHRGIATVAADFMLNLIAYRKSENRLRQTENPIRNHGSRLGYRRFFSKLLGVNSN